MKVIQFKRGISDSDSKRTELSSGEFYVNTSNESLWVGKDSGQFQIKAKPHCLYDNSNNATGVVVNISAGAEKQLNVSTMNPTTGQITVTPISVQVSGTADYAKKLVTSGSSTISEGSVDLPVYFQNGVPKQITRTTGGGKLIKFTEGVISEHNSGIGNNARPVYYKANTGFTPVDQIGNDSWKPNLTVGTVSAQGITATSLTSPSVTLSLSNLQNKFLGTTQNGQVIGYTKAEVVNAADIQYLQYHYLANETPLWSGTKEVTTSGLSGASVNMDLPGLYAVQYSRDVSAASWMTNSRITVLIYYGGESNKWYCSNSISRGIYEQLLIYYNQKLYISDTPANTDSNYMSPVHGYIYRVVQIG